MTDRPIDSVPGSFKARASASAPLWATCALLTIGGYLLLLSQGRSLINVAFIVVVLGFLAVTYLIGPTVGASSLLILGLLLAWRLPVGWLASLLPADIALQAHDVAWIAGLTVLIVALVMGISRRPPTRRPDGTAIVETQLVYWGALLCTVGGPLFVAATFGASSKDLYLRPAVYGLPIGLFGLVLFSGYAALHAVFGRARTAAILGVLYPAILIWFGLYGPSWVTPRAIAPDVIVESRLPDGRVVRASEASPDQMPANAFDGRPDTAWNAARHPPAWIEIDLGEPSAIAGIRLLVAQTPDGETIHQVTGISSTGRAFTLAEIRGVSRDGAWLSQALTPPVEDLRVIRITTLASPSWVAWREIELVVERP